MIRHSTARSPSKRSGVAHVPGLLMIRIKPDVARGLGEGRSMRRLPRSIHEPLATLLEAPGRGVACPVLTDFRTSHGLLATARAVVSSIHEVDDEDLRGLVLLRLAKGASVEAARRRLAESPAVDYVHTVPLRWLQGRKRRPRRAGADPLVNRQWGLRAIRWFDSPVPDASAVKVGILDTGVDETHPDISVARYHHASRSAADLLGHGTHVAGIISARINNAIGIAGVCRPKVHAWKIFDDTPAEDGEFYVDELAYQRGLDAARRAGVRVLNLSLGGTEKTKTEALLMKKLRESGCLVVAAMGNEYEEGNPIEYPAAYSGVLAVGAIDEASRRASFSNTGAHIGIVAPGENILSTLPVKPSDYREPSEVEYAAWSGTSMATPHVVGAAALLLAREPELAPGDVADRLRETAATVPAMGRRRWTRGYGDGLLDVAALLRSTRE